MRPFKNPANTATVWTFNMAPSSSESDYNQRQICPAKVRAEKELRPAYKTSVAAVVAILWSFP